jgi:hypothetical protein
MADPVQRDGTWWQETKDGAWLRWSATANEWKPASGPPPPPAPVSPLRAAIGFGFAHWTTLLAVGGLTVYSIVRVGHDKFYARLGVTPEEVGLNQSLILGRAALYLLLTATGVVAVAGLAILISFVLDWALSRYEGAENKSGAASTVAGVVISLVANFATLGPLVPPELTEPDGGLEQEPHWLISRPAIITVSGLALVSAALALAHGLIASAKRRREGKEERLFGLPRAWPVSVALATLVFASFVVSGRYGFVSGDAVARGLSVGPGPNGLLSVQAERVCADWLDDQPPFPFSEAEAVPYMYLGQANGIVVLYDPTGVDTPLRIPAGKVAMTEDFDEPNC